MKVIIRTLLLILPLLVGSKVLAQASSYGAAAEVNGIEISNRILEKNFEEYQRENNVNIAAIRYPGRVKEMKREVLELLIDQELVWQQVQAKKLFASLEEVDKSLENLRNNFPSEEAFLKRITIEGYTPETYRDHVHRLVSAANYMRDLSAGATVGDEEVQDFYENNPDKFQVQEMIRARHILLKVHPSANEETRKIVRERMDGIVERLAEGADFATLAGQYSEDSSAVNGGDLGYFQRGDMVKPFDDAAFALSPGEISGVIKTIYGFHVIKVEDRQPPQTVPEVMAAQQIRDYLLELKQRQAIRTELSTLRAAADIRILLPL